MRQSQDTRGDSRGRQPRLAKPRSAAGSCPWLRLTFAFIGTWSALSLFSNLATVFDTLASMGSAQYTDSAGIRVGYSQPSVSNRITTSSSLQLELETKETTLKSSDKPTLFLHAGPGKMATTYLQSLFSQPKNRPFLDDNGLLYMGSAPIRRNGQYQRYLLHDPKESASFIVNGTYSTDVPIRMTEKFHRLIDQARSSRSDAVVVFESISIWKDHHIRALIEAVSDDFRIHVMVGYRRFFDYLPSRYSQYYKHRKDMVSYTLWEDETHGSQKIHGSHYPLLDLKYLDQPDQALTVVNFTQHPSALVLDRFRQLFPPDITTFEVVNLAELKDTNKSLAQHLLCDVFRSPVPCQTWKAGKWTQSLSTNPSIPFHVDRIAFDARRAGLLANSTHSRAQVVNKIVAWQKKRTHRETFPYDICPSDHLRQRLLELSLAFEESDPEFHYITDPRDRTALHMKDFQANFNRLYCAVNTTEVLQRPHWIAFFRSLA